MGGIRSEIPGETTMKPSIHTTDLTDHAAITEALSAPFAREEVRFKPQAVKGNKALALAYVDVRVIQDRLDEVLGVENWQDEYQLLPENSVMCRLRLRIGRRWITKMDVGSPSEQPDGGDRMKAAFSDALKRAAVKFGIGRYLYRLQAQWVEYDPMRKVFTQTPKLPESALPVRRVAAPVEPRPVPAARPASGVPAPVSPPAAGETVRMTTAEVSAAARKEKEAAGPVVPDAPRRPEGNAKSPNLPADGRELHKRLQDFDTRLARSGRCQIGALLSHVTQAGIAAGYSADLTTWKGPEIAFAAEVVREFEARLPQPAPDRKAVA
jgi:Rad52/22 family double-strand break repair protein